MKVVQAHEQVTPSLKWGTPIMSHFVICQEGMITYVMWSLLSRARLFRSGSWHNAVRPRSPQDPGIINRWSLLHPPNIVVFVLPCSQPIILRLAKRGHQPTQFVRIFFKKWGQNTLVHYAGAACAINAAQKFNYKKFISCLPEGIYSPR